MSYLLHISHLTKSFREEGKSSILALDDVSFSLSSHEFATIIGPSSCGKTTLLQCIAGLTSFEKGQITLNGVSLGGTTGRVSYMMQESTLFPWRSVLQNVILPLELAGVNKKEAYILGIKYLKEFGLEQFASFSPLSLSGGMQQRVALLRAYLFDKDVMLLDEPLGSLDALTRQQMQEWFLNIWQMHKKTILFVTHDIDEALFLSDTVYVFSKRPGKIIKKISIPFRRPRQAGILISRDFNQLKKKLLSFLEV